MCKATFIRKYYGTGYSAHMVYLDYEYRGHEYTVYENRAQGNEPLSCQHHAEQNRIDRLIEQEEHKGATQSTPCRYEDTPQYAVDQFFNYINGEQSDFN